MRVQRRTTLLWAFVLIAVSLILTLRAVDALPDGAYDLMIRAWPGLLLIAGLSLLLRARVPASGAVSVAVTLALIAGMTVISYSQRASQERDDLRVTIDQPVGEAITLLQVNVTVRTTAVDIVAAEPGGGISGTFTGSLESVIDIEYTENDDGRATFALTETRASGLPRLDAVGRGRLRLALPPDVAIDLAFRAADGDVVFNLNELQLERIGLEVETGNVLVTLPDYAPQAADIENDPGTITTLNGALLLRVPETIDALLELERGGSGIDPIFDEAIYRFLQGDFLEDRDYEDSTRRVSLILTAPRGQITVQSSSAAD